MRQIKSGESHQEAEAKLKSHISQCPERSEQQGFRREMEREEREGAFLLSQPHSSSCPSVLQWEMLSIMSE